MSSLMITARVMRWRQQPFDGEADLKGTAIPASLTFSLVSLVTLACLASLRLLVSLRFLVSLVSLVPLVSWQLRRKLLFSLRRQPEKKDIG